MDNPGISGVSRVSMDTQNLALLDDLGMSGSISGHVDDKGLLTASLDHYDFKGTTLVVSDTSTLSSSDNAGKFESSPEQPVTGQNPDKTT